MRQATFSIERQIAPRVVAGDMEARGSYDRTPIVAEDLGSVSEGHALARNVSSRVRGSFLCLCPKLMSSAASHN